MLGFTMHSVLYLKGVLQGSWFAGLLSRAIPAARDRLIADHRFLFLVVAEMAIDSGVQAACHPPPSALHKLSCAVEQCVVIL